MNRLFFVSYTWHLAHMDVLVYEWSFKISSVIIKCISDIQLPSNICFLLAHSDYYKKVYLSLPIEYTVCRWYRKCDMRAILLSIRRVCRLSWNWNLTEYFYSNPKLYIILSRMDVCLTFLWHLVLPRIVTRIFSEPHLQFLKQSQPVSNKADLL